ncbi:MAG: hypothetical protein KAG89_15620 [Fulvimarina manganoxydans]|uniref:hypothetical protein n=1 Tax=Fulvimarina manganoxydans TaxID=937218 RepID=UPI002355C058|nr:hypothetical protein [Fulvimarina manganoxydans]MCK5933590.1 hypothetical protein [Fulvimarina manganoxydans]
MASIDHRKAALFGAVLSLCASVVMDTAAQQGSSAEADTQVTSSPPPWSSDLGPADLASIVPENPFAAIPPQCYTKTRDATGTVHNPCYTCHVDSPAPNYANDSDLQTAYDFPDPAAHNAWTNLFKDRRAAIAAMPDGQIAAYVARSNYRNGDRLALNERLNALPPEWDTDKDGKWDGYRPDIWLSFDKEGYDHAPDGSLTFWRNYDYAPLPGSFWPANGSFDDVAIRLPALFRTDADGRTDLSIYGLNLAIVEALVKRRHIAIEPTDETALGVDLNHDGRLGIASHVAYAFDPRNGINMSYVGTAKTALERGETHLAAGLFPEGTEFVHSLRYLAVGKDGAVTPAPRMKELRYAIKARWFDYWPLRETALKELREAVDNPDFPERFFGSLERGISLKEGWRFQGFIEDVNGDLRPQSSEETMTCAGCHGGIGRTVDSTFSFARKMDDDRAEAGWQSGESSAYSHPFPDPVGQDGKGEYAEYLRRNGAGDEFRSNVEILRRYVFGKNAAQNVAALAKDVRPLLLPSPDRATELNKAYRLIVEEQSFDKGRMPVVAPLDETVHQNVEIGEKTGIETPVE